MQLVGKSTTMNMLCGTLAATFGDAFVNNFSITTNCSTARRNLGICMQQDVIWDDISIIDHLYLFGRLRGVRGAALKEDVDKMIESLGFPEKAHSAAGTLSGGQKRRLCVGISMVGGNSVVYLDEPTAGLDPVSRRQLWELVERNREGRAILLTTHFMDEADVLGDRIAIVKEGRLRAIGSSRYLKKTFGLGYLLKFSLAGGSSKSDEIKDMIQEFIPDADVISNAGTELSLRLPKDGTDQFPKMFAQIEYSFERLGIKSYGIETSTLEEVFMRIVNEDTASLLSNHVEANKIIGATGPERDKYDLALAKRDEKKFPLSDANVAVILTKGRDCEDNQFDMRVFKVQMRVLLAKRFHQFVRSKGQWSLGTVVPLVMITLCAIIMSKIPTELLYDDPGVTSTAYDSLASTPFSGADEASAQNWANQAGLIDSVYMGSNLSEVQSYLESPSASTSNAVSFEAVNNFTVSYNATYPLWYAGIVSTLLQSAITNATNGLLTVNTEYEAFPDSAIGAQSNLGIIFGFVLSLVAGSLGAGISIVISGERVGLVKHQQMASGASVTAYWAANFIWDYSIALVELIIFAFALFCVNSSDYGGEGFLLVMLVGVMWIFNNVFRFYLFSYAVSDIRMAQTLFFYGSLGSMYFLYTIYILVVFISEGGDATSTGSTIVGVACSFLDPNVAFTLFVLMQGDFFGARTLNDDASSLDVSVAGLYVQTLVVMGVVYFFGLMVVEFSFASIMASVKDFFCCVQSRTSNNSNDKHSGHLGDDLLEGKSDAGSGSRVSEHSDRISFAINSGESRMKDPSADPKNGKMDSDVINEKRYTEGLYEDKKINPKDNAVFAHKLSKVFYGRGTQPTKVAVNDLCLSVGHGEIFGLLGANGAGKTTLLKMVSGLETPTSGCGLINGYDIVRDRSSAQRSMGLCPQFDTLVERLTVKENLLMFGNIKGLEGDTLNDTCEAFMVALNIKKYQNKLIQQLSGGNRRKVSLVVALLGAPPTVYLDEPSTGLDPVASRLMWRLLSKVAAKKHCAVILTTHNMLECEATCTRVGVMKLGELICLGNSQHLRSVYGTGFLLEMTLNSAGGLKKAADFIMEHFDGAVIVDEHVMMLNFEIPAKSVGKLSEAFGVIESNKTLLDVCDYSLSQSTLEQVFLKQIRPKESDMALLAKQNKADGRVPLASEYICGYLCWMLAFFIPGLHHFYLKNYSRGFLYLFTINEFFFGWFLDLFEMHILIQKSVQEHGNSPCCCGLCGCCCACCRLPVEKEDSTEGGDPEMQE
jgi:ATP-binding cassette, subfamily A (ABC1), member 3